MSDKDLFANSDSIGAANFAHLQPTGRGRTPYDLIGPPGRFPGFIDFPPPGICSQDEMKAHREILRQARAEAHCPLTVTKLDCGIWRGDLGPCAIFDAVFRHAVVTDTKSGTRGNASV